MNAGAEIVPHFNFRPPSSDAPAIQWALAYVRAGLAIFPFNARREPLILGGFYSAIRDESILRKWWTEWPAADPAWAVPKAVVALDLDMKDGRNGYRDFSELEGCATDEIQTPQASSPTGGCHLTYAAGETSYRNATALKHGTRGIDVRTLRGYIVLPAGRNGREWLKPLARPLAPAPAWLATLAERASDIRSSASSEERQPEVADPAEMARGRAYAVAALRGEAAEVGGTLEGGRNPRLNIAACKLGHWLASGWLEENEVYRALEAACERNGLAADRRSGGIRGVRATIRSGLSEGVKEPAQLPPDRLDDVPDYAGPILAAASEKGAPSSPQPLAGKAAPSARYPIEALGDLLAPAARAIADKIQVPPAMAAQSVLAVASLAAQAVADVRLPHGHTKPLSLFALTIAVSGDRKSSADIEAMIPVRMREERLRLEYAPKKEAFDIEHATWRGQRAKIDRSQIDIEMRRFELEALGSEPDPPVKPVLTIGETTAQGLAKHMPTLPGALGVFSAEGGQFLAGHGFTPEKKLATVASFSVLWDGSGFRRLRAGDGLTDLRGRRLAAHLMIQPDAASGILGDPVLRDQGFLARFLIAAPDTLAGERLWKEPAAELEPTLRRYAGHVCGVFEADIQASNAAGNELSPRILDFSDEARAAWVMFHDKIEREQKSGQRFAKLRDFAGKAAEQAARIAGVLAITANRDATEIDGDAMLRGCDLVARVAQNWGYSLLSLTRASLVVNCQSALA